MPSPDPNLGELAGDVLSSVTLEGEPDSGLKRVVSGLIATRRSPVTNLEGSTDIGFIEEVEGRTLVRHTVLPSGVSEPLSRADMSIGQVAPHGAQSNALLALKIALQMKSVRLGLLCLVVGFLSLFQLNDLVAVIS